MSLISLFHSLLDTCIFKIMDIYLYFDLWIKENTLVPVKGM